MNYTIKSLILFFLVLSGALANAQVWVSDRSSRTTTAESLVRIPNSGPGDVLSSVIVSSCSSTSGASFSVFDSSQQSSGLIARLHVSTSMVANVVQEQGCLGQYDFSLRISSAITYTTTNGADITILWNNNSKEQDN